MAESGARYWDGESGTCELCAHRCKPGAGKAGLCKVRVNGGKGGLDLPYRGRISSLALDPIEKKPLNHYRPGSRILSAGFVGCNLRCPFCQNWGISQVTDCPTREFTPTALVDEALAAHSFGIAYTYSEPLIHIEYLLETMEAAHRRGVENVLVSNGCVLEEPARAALSLTDACNIDLKCWDADTYRKRLGGDLESVKRFIAIARELGVHIEVTTLVVPGISDDLDGLEGIARFLSSLSPSLPWHLSAYFPAWRYDEPPTSRAVLETAKNRCAPYLEHIHLGNVR